MHAKFANKKGAKEMTVDKERDRENEKYIYPKLQTKAQISLCCCTFGLIFSLRSYGEIHAIKFEG